MNRDMLNQQARTDGPPEPEMTLEDFLVSVEKRAYRTALLSTRRAADALDVVQDTMLQLVQKYATRAPSEWPLLFQRILQNKIVDWHRAQVRTKKWFWQSPVEEEEGESDPIAELPSGDHDPADILARAKDIEQVMRSLESMPVRQRQAFLLRAWEGFDTHATAVAMGCSEGSVKTHYFRALQSLRSALGAQEVK